MARETLRYNKIKDFLSDLNTREKKYIAKKLHQDLFDTEVETIDDECVFIVNGKVLN